MKCHLFCKAHRLHQQEEDGCLIPPVLCEALQTQKDRDNHSFIHAKYTQFFLLYN